MRKLKILFVDENQVSNKQMVDLSGIAGQYHFFYKMVGLNVERTIMEIGRIEPHIVIIGGSAGHRWPGFAFAKLLQTAGCPCIIVENTSNRVQSFKAQGVDFVHNIQESPDMLRTVIHSIAPTSSVVPAVHH
jgi:hypothetical protein